ncbi:hypothetical protein [uncultured Wocania sp.]|uniref:hypothetical protein n=1 Tax=uncultured Wocania sp. TaxID=2834404 RepID=UPI0030F7F664
MEPITITAAILNQFQTSAIVSTLIGGIIGNRSDALLCKSTKKVYQKIRNTIGEPFNHDIQKSVRKSYLKSTLIVVNHIKKNYQWYDSIANDKNPADIRHISNYLKKEINLLDRNNIRFPNLDVDEEYQKLLFPIGKTSENRIPDIVKLIKKSVFKELKINGLRVELALEQSIEDGWNDDGKLMSWYDLTCAFFREELKTNPRISTFIQTEYLDIISLDIKDVKFQIENILKPLDSFVKEYKSYLSKIDEILNITKNIESTVVDTSETTIEISQKITEIKELLDVTNNGATENLDQIEPPQVISINTFSDENLLEVLSFFEKNINEKKLSEEELADIYDTKAKLYATIFKDFDNQLETKYKDKLSGVIFDRIISFKEIEKTDFDTIQSIRNNKKYNYKDRSLLVSGISIGVLNNFDSSKINLLIDFLTDFEEDVWQKALVGLILCLLKYDNRLSLFPEISKRLVELKKVSKIQKGIIYIERILRYRSFSPKDVFQNNKRQFIITLQGVFGNTLEFDKKDLKDIKKIIDNKLEFHEDHIMSKVVDYDKLTQFYSKYSEKDSFTATFGEYFNCLDYNTYVELYELNPLQFKMDSEIFKEPKSWFIPFDDDEKIRDIMIKNFTVPSIDIGDFIDCLKRCYFLSDIDKNYIIVNIKSFSEDFINVVYIMAKHEEEIFQRFNTKSKLELSLNKIIRELYRFRQLSIIPSNENIFRDKLSIYDKTLLDKIGDKLTNIKIKAKHHFDNRLYIESLKILEESKIINNDYEILELYALNNFYLKRYDESKVFIEEILVSLKKTKNLDRKAYWFKKLNSVYFNLKDYDEYEKYLNKEIVTREDVFAKTIAENNNNDELIMGKAIDLASAYFSLSVNYWNIHKDVYQSIVYFLKYLKTFLNISTINSEQLLKLTNQNRKSIISLILIYLENENLKVNTKRLEAYINENLESDFQKKLNDLFCNVKEINELEGNKIVFNNDEVAPEVIKHIELLYNTLLPIAKNVLEGENEFTKIAVPFNIDKKGTFDVKLVLDEVIEKKEKYLLEELASILYTGIKNDFIEKAFNVFIKQICNEKAEPHYSIEEIRSSLNSYIEYAKLPTTENENTTDE